METVKSLVKLALHQVLGPELGIKVRNVGPDWKTLMKCYINPDYWHSIKRLELFKDRHKGQRCFIIGNGPSLKGMDLTRLRKENTFGLNRIYLLFDKMGFSTTYFLSMNRYVIEQCSDDIVELPCPKFMSWNARNIIPLTSNMVFIPSRRGPRFFKDPSKGIWPGATVTFAALQLAYYMGFQQVILIGVDHSFETKGRPHQLVTSEGDDPNHFDPNYFGKGFRWQLPDLETSEIAYRLAREAYERDGRLVVDATVGGKLQIFPKMPYEICF
jgi:6-hydroxymethylpterin diphosphokinase MptE-like protein